MTGLTRVTGQSRSGLSVEYRGQRGQPLGTATATPVHPGHPGWVYVLHLDPPLHHAQHYIGHSHRPVARFEAHIRGRGANIIKHAIAAGCRVTMTTLFVGSRLDERQIKAYKNSRRFCLTCRNEG